MPFNQNPLFYVTVEIPTSKQVLMTYLDNKTKMGSQFNQNGLPHL